MDKIINIKDLGRIIKIRRKYLRITQEHLCEIAGISHHTLSDIESGKGNPTIEVIKKILNPLGMELTVSIRD